MIASLLVAAAVSVAPAPAQATPAAHDLIAGASHAVQANRLDQAAVMISRAIGAGASGPELDRLLADFAYASGKYPEALARYEELAKVGPADPSLFEAAGISALKLDKVERASSLLSLATAQRRASWRSWNAAGVVADLRHDWPKADDCYDHASRLAPREAAPINNRGWSLVLRGDWRGAVGFFERAIALDPKSERAADNLELAKAALDADLPSRQAGESDSSWAARLNDAGVAAAILGNKSRASAAFTQALNASGSWYTRAANNLEALGSR